MKKRFANYLNPSLLLFLVLAALLWYGNKLEGRYTSDVVLPIQIDNDYSASVWVENPRLQVQARVEGMGGELLAYKLGIEERIRLAMSQLTLLPSDPERMEYNIDRRSLISAISATNKDFRILQILDTAVKIRVSPVESRRLPVQSRIEIQTARQYMQVGEVRFRPDSVDVRAPLLIFDSVTFISTKARSYRDQKGVVSGRVELEPVAGGILSERQVSFWAEVVPFTQYTVDLPVEVSGMPDGFSAVVIPSSVEVTVNVPLNAYERLREERLQARIDYLEAVAGSSGKCAVRIDSLPLGAELLQVEPAFVEPFFTRH